MATVDSSSRQDLFNKLDPECYINMKIERLKNHGRIERVLSDWLYGVFSEGFMKGETLLDVGTGPNINSVLYATSYFNKIYLSDFSKNNIDFLEEWRKGSHRETQRPYIKEAVKREGNVQTLQEKEIEVLSKIEGVLKCDVLQENPLCENQLSVPRQFDAVTTGWCLDTAAVTKAEYEQALKNVSTLIKPGGHLVLMGINNYSKEYEINGVMFPALRLEVDEAKSLFNTSYMKMVEWELRDDVIFENERDYLYNVVAQIL